LPILQQFGLFDRDRIANTDGPATVTYSRSSSSKCARNLASRWFRINIRNTDFGIQQGAAGSAVFEWHSGDRRKIPEQGATAHDFVKLPLPFQKRRSHIRPKPAEKSVT
jgi:hypothetical protein